MRILLETGTESEWVAQALEAGGHEVVVADPHYAPMYGALQRKVKTDRRDVTALAEANRRGWYRVARRVSAPQRATRQVLRSRRLLVQMRSGAVALVRSLLKHDGYRLPSCGAAGVPARLAALGLPASLAATLTPLGRMIEATTREIAGLDRALQARAAGDPVVTQLQTVPGVGLIVAVTFRAPLDDIGRFAHAGQVSAAIGLVPRKTAPPSAGIGDTSPKRGRASCGACWCKRRGRVGGVRPVPRSARGSSNSPRGAAGGSRWSPWRGVSVGF